VSITRSWRSRLARSRNRQGQLESQQTELEQTNSQLEEQAHLLEHHAMSSPNAQSVLARETPSSSVPTNTRASSWPT